MPPRAKRRSGGFDDFPFNIGGLQSSIDVDLTLTNGEGAVIGKQTCPLKVSFNREYKTPSGGVAIIPRTEEKEVRFPGVQAGELKGEVKVTFTQISWIRNNPLKRSCFENLRVSTLPDLKCRLWIWFLFLGKSF